ncbi:MAG: HipA domain-containing protein [Clostridia bacterium]|nr:HipA domain-containing protein [Clostridia bacterium]
MLLLQVFPVHPSPFPNGALISFLNRQVRIVHTVFAQGISAAKLFKQGFHCVFLHNSVLPILHWRPFILNYVLRTISQSYLDIAEFITAYGSNPQEDLEELWKRILFSIAISNTDDHLRNHGFLLTHQGWRLSPLYDVNPVPYGEMLALNISLDDARMDPELAIDVAPYFGIKKQAARETAQKLLGTIRRLWRPLSADCGLTHASQEAMAPAFDVAEHF